MQLLTADSAVVHGPGGSIGDAESYFLRMGTTVTTGGPQRLARVFLPPPAMAGGKWVASEGRDSRGRGAGSHVQGSDPSGRAEVGNGARDRPEAWNDAGFAVLGGGAAGWSECRVLQRLGEATYVVHLVSADRQAIYPVCCVCAHVCVCVRACMHACVCMSVCVRVCCKKDPKRCRHLRVVQAHI